MFAESPLRTMRHRGRRGDGGGVSQVESCPHGACELINGLWADAIRNMDARGGGGPWGGGVGRGTKGL